MARPPSASKSAALRRYPALAWLVAAGLLALLLPSGLTLPQSGPPTLAEYAPVPGAGEGSSEVGELGLSESGGLGSGSGVGRSGGATAPEDESERPAPGRIVRKAGTKRCVGNPPRQSEDPMSPPCIAFFEGDNGGATAAGVTRDEVIAIFGANFNNGATSRESPRLVDCAGAAQPSDNIDDTLCRAYMHFFNDRYQTYGRTVHLFANHGVTAPDVEAQLKPFIWAGGSAGSGTAKRSIVSTTYSGSSRATYSAVAPYLVSFRPDSEDTVAISASYICVRLVGRPARYSPDPSLASRQRRIGYWHGDSGLDAFDSELIKAINSQCGYKVVDFARGIQDPTAAARFRADNVTTVIFRSTNNTSQGVITGQATQAAYFPEWIVPGTAGLRDVGMNFYGRLADQSQWRNAFGLTFDYRREAFPDQMWFRAYKEGCPECAADVSNPLGPELYDQLALLFYGIQSAGPRLTAQNIDRGLHAITPYRSTDPFQPAAYFAPGNYSLVKDAAAYWWDPAGQAPTGGTGCYRLVDGGKRSRAGEWPTGDDGVKGPGPCQGDAYSPSG